jgi:orotate phosphoribosyltransferase-like protein
MLSREERAVSAAKLAREINVSQPTAWLMLNKLRKAMTEEDSNYVLIKIAELNETYLENREENEKDESDESDESDNSKVS